MLTEAALPLSPRGYLRPHGLSSSVLAGRWFRRFRRLPVVSRWLWRGRHAYLRRRRFQLTQAPGSESGCARCDPFACGHLLAKCPAAGLLARGSGLRREPRQPGRQPAGFGRIPPDPGRSWQIQPDPGDNFVVAVQAALVSRVAQSVGLFIFVVASNL